MQSAETPPDTTATVVIAVEHVPEDLDPLGSLTPWGLRIASDLVFEGLVRRSSAGHPWTKPALADRCRTDDPMQTREVVCHLRRGVQFHDGTEVTTEDVVYSVQRWLDPRLSAVREAWGLGDLESVEVVDTQDAPGRWVRIRFAEPNPLALERLADIKVVPRGQHRGRVRAFGQQPIGTGPMRVVSMSSERLVLQRVESADVPAARIVLRAMTDGAAALTALRRGEVHILAEMAPIHVPEELAKPGMAARFTAHVLTPPRFDLALYNLRRSPLSDGRFRTAIDTAVPRAEVAREIHAGMALATEAPVDLRPPEAIDMDALAADGPSVTRVEAGLPAAPVREGDEAGQAEAVAALERLGWALGRGLRRKPSGHLRLVLMWNGAEGDGAATARALRDAWRALGIQVPYATASWAYLRGLLGRGDFDVALTRLAEHDDADLYRYFHSEGASNWSGISDERLDEALTGYRRARSRSQRDAAKVAVARRLAELRPVSVIAAPVQVMVVSRRVVGLQFEDDLPRLDRLGLLPPTREGRGGGAAGTP